MTDIGGESPRIAAGERRRFPRTRLESPLDAFFGEVAVRVVDISATAVAIEHDAPLRASSTGPLSFGWYEPVEVDTLPIPTRQVRFDGGLRSVLQIDVPPGSLVRSLALRLAFERITRLESLVEASRLVNSEIEPGALVESILTVARSSLGVERGRVYFVDHSSDEIWTELAGRGKQATLRFPIGRGLAGSTARTGETLMLDDVHSDSRFDADVDLVSGFGSGSMLCVPVANRSGTIVGVLQFIHEQYRSFTSEDREFLQVISQHIAIAMQNAESVLDRLEMNRMDMELRLGREIQMALLPEAPEDWWGVEVSASSESCLQVGGDYHDFLEFPDGEIGVAIGDVSGKGVAAALIMSSAQAALRVAAPAEPDLSRLVSRLDELLLRTTPNGKFSTFFLARFDRTSGILRYVNAGHLPPLVCSRGVAVRLETTGRPLGLVKSSQFREAAVPLEIGSTLVLYTDGFTEACSPEGVEFGAERWESLVLELSTQPVPEMLRLLTAAVSGFEDGAEPSDDKTLVILRRTE